VGVPQILIVEDNPADQALAREALKQSRWNSRAVFASDAQEALRYLSKQAHGARSLPNLIRLDLNLPGLDGRELLRKIRDELRIKTVPIVVLTSSSANEDVRFCYECSANSYVQKPTDLAEFFEVVRGIEEYWFHYSTLPH
jgi:CheY-like chemotaxis protein